MSDGQLLQAKRNEENPLQQSRVCRPESTQSKRSPKRECSFRYLGLSVGQYGRVDHQVVDVREQTDEEEHSAHIGPDSMQMKRLYGNPKMSKALGKRWSVKKVVEVHVLEKENLQSPKGGEVIHDFHQRLRFQRDDGSRLSQREGMNVGRDSVRSWRDVPSPPVEVPRVEGKVGEQPTPTPLQPSGRNQTAGP